MITAPRIARLPQVVADSIAAGEVIERPAAVVKELAENALDAGATHIHVAIEGGGLVRIEVTDDGAGIAADDIGLAVARHATSKIERVEDLARVRTLGFRGEALASIAAVSDLRLVSRQRGGDAGVRLRVRCGERSEPEPAAAPVGTRVEVCELFATTPARLRFLRSAAAEAAAALRVLTDLALVRHEVAFACRVDGRQALQTHGGSLRDALRSVHGVRAAELIELDAPGMPAVAGAISAPHAHRGQRGGLVVAVNRRRVQHRGLQVAVEEAYRGLIPNGRYPFGIVLIDVDPAEVDVNVHPSKREVRFHHEGRVFTAVQRACWAALQSAPAATAAAGLLRASPPEAEEPALVLADAPPDPGHWGGAEHQAAAGQAPGAAPSLSDLAPLRALGQAGGEWLVAAGQGALLLVDPHAAHEKTIYQDLLRQWGAPHTAARDTQLLLIPALVHCDPARMERVERHRAFIESCGFTLDVFGPDTVRCSAVPATGGGADAERLVSDVIDALGDDGVAVDVRRARVAALVACHSAVRFGDHLDGEAQQRLLDRLVATPGGMTCPHGRPTVVVLDDASLRRAFRRPPR